MAILTPDQIALAAHIEAENAKTLEWVNAAPGRWAGMLVSDPLHWAEQDIFSIADLQLFEARNLVWELYYSVNGHKPRHLGLWGPNGWTLAECEEEIASLSAHAALHEKADAASHAGKDAAREGKPATVPPEHAENARDWLSAYGDEIAWIEREHDERQADVWKADSMDPHEIYGFDRARDFRVA